MFHSELPVISFLSVPCLWPKLSHELSETLKKKKNMEMQNSRFFLIIGFVKARSGERKNPWYVNIRAVLQPTLAQGLLT